MINSRVCTVLMEKRHSKALHKVDFPDAMGPDKSMICAGMAIIMQKFRHFPGITQGNWSDGAIL